MKAEIKGQPNAIATGPPLFQACPNVVKHPVKIEMIENEIAKLENPDHDRLSSCLYPSAANLFSSSEVCEFDSILSFFMIDNSGNG